MIEIETTCPSGDCDWDKIEYVWGSECEVTSEPSHATGCSMTPPRRNETTGSSDTIELPCNITFFYHDQSVWETHVSVYPIAGSPEAGRAMAIFVPRTFITPVGGSNMLDVNVDDDLFNTQFVEGILAGVLNPVRAYAAGRLEWSWDEKNYTLQARMARVTECALAPCRKGVLAFVHNHTARTTVKDTTLMTLYYPSKIGDYNNGFNTREYPEVYECVQDMTSPPPVWKHNMTAYLPLTNTTDGYDVAPDDFSFLDEDGQAFCHHMRSGWRDRLALLDSRLLGNATSLGFLLDNGTFLNSASGVLFGALGAESNLYALISGSGKIQTALENVTTALDVAGLRESDEYAIGQMFETVPVLIVEWGWLAAPIILEILGCVFLVLVMLRTRHLGINLWKTSILPSAFYALLEEKHKEADARTVSQMV